MQTVTLGFLSAPGWLWWFAFLAACGIGVWAYHRLLAPLGRGSRWLMTALRVAALVTILLMLLEPVVTSRQRDQGRPRLAVLLDRSSSMLLDGDRGGRTRADEAAAAWERIQAQLGERFELDLFHFTSTLEAQPHPTGAPGEVPAAEVAPTGATALGDALEAVVLQESHAPLGGILVLTDGVQTSGKDPARVARNIPVPIFLAVLGDTLAPADVLVREVNAPPVAQVGEPLALRTVVEYRGQAEREVTLRVAERIGLPTGEAPPAVARSERSLSIGGAGAQGGEQVVTLEVTPSRVGRTLYEIEVAGADSEAVTINNRRLVAVDVREKKTHVLYLEGRPDWDFGFLKRTLDADTTLAYTYFVRQAEGGFLRYGAPGEDGADLPASAEAFAPYAAVLVGHLAPGELPAATVSALRPFLLQGGGLFFLGGHAEGHVRAWEQAGWSDLLPLVFDPQPSRGYATTPVAPTFAGIAHEVTALVESPRETERLWRGLPPVWLPEGSYSAAAAATVLLEGELAQPPRSVPLLALAPAGGGRIGVLAARGMWRWDFVARGADAATAGAGDFWRRLMRWLAEPAERQPFAVHPLRGVFQDSEPIVFEARLLDDAFRPISGARVALSLAGTGAGAPARRASLFPEGEAGRYRGRLAPLPPGGYRYEASAQRGQGAQRRVWRAEGAFWVERMGPEFLHLAASRRLPERIAAAAGGVSVPASELDSLLTAIPHGYRATHVVRQAEVWNHVAVFMVLITFLAIEWALRRRRGLA